MEVGGGVVKWKSVRKVIGEKKVQMLCLQETKRKDIVDGVCYALWWSNDIRWLMKLSMNMAGGLLSMWKKDAFGLEDSFMGKDI